MAVRFSTLLATAALAAATPAAPAAADPFDLIGGLLSRDAGETRVARRDRVDDVEHTGAIDPAPAPAGQPAPAAPQTFQTAPQTMPHGPAPAVVAPKPAAPRRAAAQAGSYPVDLLISLANDAVFTTDPYPKGQQSDPRMIKLQVLLDRNNASPGVIDGLSGDNVVKAVKAFEEMKGHAVDGIVDAAMWAALEATSAEPVLASYTLTPEDVAGPFVATMPHDYAEQAQLPGLSYRDAAEMLAERFHMDEAFLRRLNPDVTFDEAGVDVVVANVGKPLKAKVAHIVADKARKQLRGYDAQERLIVAYPATIGSSDTPSPTGHHKVKAIALNPDYWYRPKVNFVQGANTKALRLPPGPNGPVGATWIGLDKPTYGLHGTPEPSKIDKTNSHGCVRLTNWDARELAGLVQPGVQVDFQEPESAPAPETVLAPEGEPMADAAPAAEPERGRALVEDFGARPVEAPAPAAAQTADPAPKPLEPLPAPRTVPEAPRVRQSMR